MKYDHKKIIYSPNYLSKNSYIDRREWDHILLNIYENEQTTLKADAAQSANNNWLIGGNLNGS